ncbi:MAG: glycosyltransferase family 4 protein [Desulfobacterota bacterium]|nr:glycosyltransferase family 4 protein [Thermodesulfobacteriota bacterium]
MPQKHHQNQKTTRVPRRRIAVVGLRGIPATWGGVEHHCEQLYTRLAAMGYDITVYGRRGYVPRHVSCHKGVRVRRLPTLVTKYTDTILYTLCAISMVLVDKPDIVHFHAQGPALLSWVPRLLKPRMRIFFTCHGLDWQRKKWPLWASRIIKFGEWCSATFPHYGIVVSKHLREYYWTQYHRRMAYIPNGIVIPPSTSADALAHYALQPKSYMLWVGRIVPEKRLEDVLRAYLKKPRRYLLVIAGDLADGRAYMDMVQQIATGCPMIRFLGFQYGTLLQQLYAHALAFVTASELEGMPLTLLEALAHGTPCVASDIPPHREILEPLGGMLFPTGDIEGLATCLDAAEQLDEPGRLQYRRAALDMLSRIYSWDVAAQAHDLLYQQALSGIDDDIRTRDHPL